jgi:hypothetical protein
MQNDIVLATMIELKVPLTVERYITFAYFGDYNTLDQVRENCPEDYCELLSLIEDGVLVDTRSEYVN